MVQPTVRPSRLLQEPDTRGAGVVEGRSPVFPRKSSDWVQTKSSRRKKYQTDPSRYHLPPKDIKCPLFHIISAEKLSKSRSPISSGRKKTAYGPIRYHFGVKIIRGTRSDLWDQCYRRPHRSRAASLDASNADSMN